MKKLKKELMWLLGGIIAVPMMMIIVVGTIMVAGWNIVAIRFQR